MGEPKKDYDLTCWYLNLRRVMELVGGRNLDPYLRDIHSMSQITNPLHSTRVEADAKDALLDWIKLNQPKTLGQLILSEKIAAGKMFTHYTNFFCVGLSKHKNISEEKQKKTKPPEIYAKLDELLPDARLRIQYHPKHLTSESAWYTLSGQRQLFVLGIIDHQHENTIKAFPYVIATLMPDIGERSSKGSRWVDKLEVFVDHIDTFALVNNEPIPAKNDLSLLKDIPEKDVKRAIAEIIGEPTVPKDWGGETSDLFSSFVVLDENRISTAFAFKGKAKFKPMRMADLGKNGDQIHRLFSEPADLLILQHCHEITPPVRGAMRAYATNVGNPRLFSLINGYDTIRILRAYGKCGFSPTKRTKT